MEGRGDVNSEASESPGLQKEKPVDVDGSCKKEENDVLQVKAGDSSSLETGDPVPKLMS